MCGLLQWRLCGESLIYVQTFNFSFPNLSREHLIVLGMALVQEVGQGGPMMDQEQEAKQFTVHNAQYPDCFFKNYKIMTMLHLL